jgi:tRNA modification GTPase
VVEKIGIERSNSLINTADIIMFVTDGEEVDSDELLFLSKLKDKRLIKVVNKSDLNKLEINTDTALSVSCKDNVNIELLKSRLFDLALNNANTDGEFITQKRHYYALEDAFNALQAAINAIDLLPLDLVSADIKEC